MKEYTLFSYFFAVIVSLLLCWNVSVAQPVGGPPENNAVDEIADSFQAAAAKWGEPIQKASLRLFWLLAGISFTWGAMQLALQGGDIKDSAAFLVTQVMTIGFFLYLLTNSGDIATYIISSLGEISKDATTVAGGIPKLSPGGIFDAGLDLTKKVSLEISFWDPGASLGVIICTIIIFIAFVLIAAELLLLTIQMYIVINAATILTAFGGAPWTRGLAINYLRLALNVGLQLFVIQLVIGLGQSFITSWAEKIGSDNTQVFTMVGVTIVFLVLTKRLPAISSQLVAGQLSAGGPSIGNTLGATLGGTATAAMMAAGGGMLMKQTYRAGAKAIAEGPSKQGSLGSAARGAIGGVKSLGRASAREIRGAVTGARPPWGTPMGRVAKSMKRDTDTPAESLSSNTIEKGEKAV